ncbi:MAG: VanW family protein [bacterium]
MVFKLVNKFRKEDGKQVTATMTATTETKVLVKAKTGGNIRPLLIAGIVILGIALIFGAMLFIAQPSDGKIANGVRVLEQDLSGLTPEMATSKLSPVITEMVSQPITLSAGEYSKKTTLKEIGVALDVSEVVKKATAIGRTTSPFKNLLHMVKLSEQQAVTPLPFTLRDEKTKDILVAMAKKIDVPAKDATGKWDSTTEKMKISAEQTGKKLDVAGSIASIQSNLIPALQERPDYPERLELPVVEDAPKVTAAILGQIDSSMGTFTTAYATSTENRASNVETAAKAINNTLLMPGEEFSFNKVVGPRTEQAGFVTAPVIMDGQLQPGMGGGICQVSTTLYNAALLTNMKITKRSHHSLPIHYAPPGRDATVSYDALDLRFENSTSAPILISTYASNRKLTVSIYGKGPAPKVNIVLSDQYDLPIKNINKDDPTLPKGYTKIDSPGKPGKAVTVTRVVGEGPDAKREPLSKDKYNGEPSITLVGTGPETLPIPED